VNTPSVNLASNHPEPQGTTSLDTEARLTAWLQLQRARRDLRLLLATEPQDFEAVHAKLQEIRELEAAAGTTTKIDADDPATWPQTMQQDRAEWWGHGYIVHDREDEESLSLLKEDVLAAAVLARLGERFNFADAAIRYLVGNLPKGSIEHTLACALDGQVWSMLTDAAAMGMRLGPRLQALLPYETAEQLLAALKAGDSDEPGE